GDMLPGAPSLQSFQFVQRSQHRSGKRGFMPLEVFEWLCKHFQDPRDFERKIIELSPREKELLLVISKSFAVVSCQVFTYQQRRHSVRLDELVLPDRFLRLLHEQFCTTASVKRRLKNRDSAEPPKVGDDLLCQRTFELALGIQAGQYTRAKKLKVIGVLVWQDY